jgi:nucleotide-binding universal stress UspA family protein
MPKACPGLFFANPMKKLKCILIASHGTPGARAAEREALAQAAPGTTLAHLIVVPDFWKGMQGDDWLNNASTRDVFAKHIETQLEQEVKMHILRVEKSAKARRLKVKSQMLFGDPAECLLAYAKKIKPDLVVTGAPRPKGSLGYRSRLLTHEVLRQLKRPLLVVPHPV